mgnify:CR=1 FL=1
MRKKVEICGVDTSALPKLNNKQITELFALVKKGDADARNRFINANLRLVLSIVQRYSSRNGNPDDMFQIGCVGQLQPRLRRLFFHLCRTND